MQHLLRAEIRSHSESHIVELDDGSRWQIFPGDLDLNVRSCSMCAAEPVANRSRRSEHLPESATRKPARPRRRPRRSRGGERPAASVSIGAQAE
jgi:hypothetical protein